MGTLKILLLALSLCCIARAKAQMIKETFEKETYQTLGNFELKKVKRINSALLDHTRNDSTHHSLLITGLPNDQIGFSQSVGVKPGDTIELKVYAKYRATKTMKSSAAIDLTLNVLSMLMPGMNRIGMEQMISTITNHDNPFFIVGLDTHEDHEPKGYLNWIIFNESHKMVDLGYKKMSKNASEWGQDVAHELLYSGKLPITSKGYLFTYLSNEKQQDVYFDDFSIEQILAFYIDTERDENMLTEDGKFIIIE